MSATSFRIGAALRAGLLLAAAALTAASCYSPELTSGRIHCGPERLCPSGFHCGADGLCHDQVASRPDLGPTDSAPADTTAPGSDAPGPAGDGQPVGIDTGTPPDADADAAPACIDTLSDSENCGSCGHSCRGAACVEGLCTPELLAQDASSPTALALLPDQLFWVQSSNDDVVRLGLPSAGVEPLRIADHNGGDPVAIVADPVSGEVFWTESASRSLWRHAPPYAPQSELQLTRQPDGRPADLAIDGTHVYFADADARALLRLPRTATPADAAPEALVTDVRPTALALHQGTVYWLDRSGGTVNATDPSTRANRVLAGDEQGPLALALDATHVYWLVCGEKDDCSKAQLRRLALADGTAPEVLLTEQKLGAESGPGALAVDGTHVYWVAFALGQVHRLPMAMAVGESPSTPLVLVSGPPGPRALALDATHVYWVNQKAGTVQRVAR